ncbi:MAG: sigma-54 dependent transcriptional regulator [Bacteroidota bacterium]
MNFQIFIVEDDPWYAEILKHHLSLNPEYTVSIFESAEDCLNQLHAQPDVICVDYGLPDMDGNQLLAKIRHLNNNIPVIVISAQEEIAVAVDLLKAGAKDYIIKNEHTKDLLWQSILNIREHVHLRKEVAVLKEQLAHKYTFQNSIIGQSSALQPTFKLMEKALSSNINVSVVGETGTGKELVAKAIHFNGERRKQAFVAVNMAAIPKELLESELFGHEKGAFTGAINRKIGKFEEANGGTIFLDEIGELDLNIQSKLLRVLQEREVVRVGGNKTVKFNVRLITATHKDLKEEVQKGNFRSDLYYRIVGLPIKLPPLRARDKDVLILAKHFIKEYTKSNNNDTLQLSSAAKQKLMQYNYPGNVRELKAVIDLACVMSDGKEIAADDISFQSIQSEETFMATEKTLREYNIAIIQYFLKKYDNNVVKVAQKLDIGKSKIYNMIKMGELNHTS